MGAEINSFKEMQDEVDGKRILVFGGFSGMGYADEDKLKATIAAKLGDEISKHGKDNIAVICGATSDGIGVVYGIAKDMGLSTYGIVSEAGKEYGSDKGCDKTFFVPDPNNTWQVKSPEGDSYMVDVAKNNGTLIYYGGGDVAVEEIKEAKKKGISTEVDTSFDPNPAKVAKKMEKNPAMDPTPLRSYMATSEKISSMRDKCGCGQNKCARTVQP